MNSAIVFIARATSKAQFEVFGAGVRTGSRGNPSPSVQHVPRSAQNEKPAVATATTG
jgi:hypothetical protein